MKNIMIDNSAKNDETISSVEPSPILKELLENLRCIVGDLNHCNYEITEKISSLHTPINQLYVESTHINSSETVIQELDNLIFKLDCIRQHAQNNNKHLSTII